MIGKLYFWNASVFYFIKVLDFGSYLGLLKKLEAVNLVVLFSKGINILWEFGIL